MALKCTNCDDDKTYADYRAARGHVKFSSGDGHGDEQEIPDNYKKMFEEVDDPGNGESSDSGSDSGNEGGDGSSTSSASGGSSGGGSRGSATDSDSGGEGGDSSTGFVRKVLDTDVRDLLGGRS